MQQLFTKDEKRTLGYSAYNSAATMTNIVSTQRSFIIAAGSSPAGLDNEMQQLDAQKAEAEQVRQGCMQVPCRCGVVAGRLHSGVAYASKQRRRCESALVMKQVQQPDA